MIPPGAPAPGPAARDRPPGRRELTRSLRKLPGWQLTVDGRRIVRSLTFPSGVSSLLFTFIILELATETGRMPLLDIKGKELRVVLGSYEHGVAWADLALARRINLGE